MIIGDIYIHIHIHIDIDIDDYWYDLCTEFMDFYNHLYEYIFVPTTLRCKSVSFLAW